MWCRNQNPVFAPVSRRELLRSAGYLLAGATGLGALHGEDARLPHSTPKARNVIFCFMDGGPSHVDTFDYKPMLKKHQGQAIGKRWVSRKSQSDAARVWFGSPWNFRQRGESGLWVSDLFPNIASIADELCVVRSVVGELPLHGQSNLLLHTGRILGQAPSLGAWVSYGLGTDNHRLPGYVLLNNDWVPNGGMENFGSSFLPASYQATMMRARGNPVDNIAPQESGDVQQKKLDLIVASGRDFAARTSSPEQVLAVARNYETAFQMQRTIPEVADLSQEPRWLQERYGMHSPDEHQRYYASQMIRARRLIEAGVRFVEITCPSFDNNNSPWDQHSHLKQNHEKNATVTEQSVAALICDLRDRGLLDETIVVWAGEMGRTPHTPAIHETAGRDHHVSGFSVFFAGGGFRRGLAWGATDEFGANAVENPVSVHDLHATMLHQLGLDHERLTYRYGGRDQRLTDVHGRVLTEILAGA